MVKRISVLLVFVVALMTFVMADDPPVTESGVRISIIYGEQTIPVDGYYIELHSNTTVRQLFGLLVEHDVVDSYVASENLQSIRVGGTDYPRAGDSGIWEYSVNDSKQYASYNDVELHEGNDYTVIWEFVFEQPNTGVPELPSQSSRSQSNTDQHNPPQNHENEQSSDDNEDHIPEYNREEQSETESHSEPEINGTPRFNWTETHTTALNDAINFISGREPGDYYLISTGMAGRGANIRTVSGLISDIHAKGGSYTKPSEMARDILSLTFLRENPFLAGGETNLISLLADFDNIESEGAMGVIFALLALDSNDYDYTGKHTRENLIDIILQYRNDDGGFSLYKEQNSDIETTALAVTALSAYADTAESVSAAQDYLLRKFKSGEIETADAMSRLIVSIAAAGGNYDNYSIYGIGIVDALLSFQDRNGGFNHSNITDDANIDSTEQAVIALVAVRNNLNPYRLHDIMEIPTEPDQGSITNKSILIWIAVGVVVMLLISGGVLFVRVKMG
ncbi:MAG: hypothetical protein FWH14_06660 [Oscillospiraceae bacterium]|nr:hypothetical protein [Oscillospiraceae bacterium]